MVSETEIRELVHAFYDKVRDDALLGPVFQGRLAARWDTHLSKMHDFWSSILLTTGRYLGDPIGVHRGIEGIRPEHFDQWIDLFEETLEERFSEPTALEILRRAKQMRAVLERHADATSEPDEPRPA